MWTKAVRIYRMLLPGLLLDRALLETLAVITVDSYILIQQTFPINIAGGVVLAQAVNQLRRRFLGTNIV